MCDSCIMCPWDNVIALIALSDIGYRAYKCRRLRQRSNEFAVGNPRRGHIHTATENFRHLFHAPRADKPVSELVPIVSTATTEMNRWRRCLAPNICELFVIFGAILRDAREKKIERKSDFPRKYFS